MKRVLLFATVILLLPTLLLADSKKKSSKPAPKGPSGIHWITSFDELQAKMKKNPKKVYMDVYTGWCGWCKKMDVTTFTNPDVIRYMNANFYAVKLDAERQDTIRFMNKVYYFEPSYKANTFAAELLKGQMSYPTSVIMLENFQSPQSIPGYNDVARMEGLLTYIGDNIYQRQSWDEFSKAFKPTWKQVAPPDMAPPPGH